MADQQHRAGVVREAFLQQLQRLQVQVVGRFVQHHQVGWRGEGARQGQPAALAARQHADRGVGLLGAEQEVLHVADDVAVLAADRDRVAGAAGQRLGQGLRRVQRLAALVQRDLGQVGAKLHLAGVGKKLAGEHVQQCGLARAVVADNADPVAAHDTGGEIAHNGGGAMGFRDPLGHHDQTAGQVGHRGVQLDAANGGALFLVPFPQRVQVAQALLVALAAGGDAIAQPVLLHGDLAAHLVPVGFLLFQHLVAPGLELREPLVEHAGDAAIKPDGGARQAFQQAAVMADDDNARTQAGEFAFKPLDAGQVEVVGRLVQQQDVGFGRQHARQGGAASLPAGKLQRVLAAGQAELFKQKGRAVLVGSGGVAQAGLDILQRCGVAGEVGFLRQVAYGRAGLREAAAGIRLDQVGGDAQQGGLARPVAADQAHPVTGRDSQSGA